MITAAPRGVEIACDESGYEGDKLIGTSTDVFAHASVRLDPAAAAACMAELRDRIRSPALEYKAGHVLREKHRAVLTWLLGPAGPVSGKAWVYLVDKEYFLVARVTDLLDAEAPGLAAALYREGREAFGAQRWQAFLGSFHDRLRADQRDRPASVPVLDPLIPAIVRAVGHWSGGGEPVSIVHDQQNTLTAERVGQLRRLVGGPWLASLTLVDSRADPRVQVADVVAGVARKLASDELNGRADPRLTALLRPYVDPYSSWGEPRSGGLLGAQPANGVSRTPVAPGRQR
jgi:hypothetical protein